MHYLIIFASGAGSNTAAIISYFKNNPNIRVALIVCNKLDAGVIGIAKAEDIPFLLINKNTFQQTMLLEQLADCKPSLIILAGFLWLLPPSIIHAFPGKIINIHPALLPKYGGKGMYGQNIHKAVIASGDDVSGITIHYVNEHYDEGGIIMQAHCKIEKGKEIGIEKEIAHETTAQQLADKIHQLEHYFYPRAIEFLLQNK